MGKEVTSKQKWLKSQPVTLNFQEGQIDREAGIIRDVVMAQAGPAKGHGYHLEESFIQALVEYDSKYYAEKGLKARFGHPALSDTTMGSQMGYFRNFRTNDEGNRALADLHLLAAGDSSPKAPKMREWMLQMATEATDFVMSSIVFKPSGYYQYNPETGARVELGLSRWGDPERIEFENERIYVDFNEEQGAMHLYTDLVEAGAATDSLFSQQFNADKFAVRTIEWLQENGDILDFIKGNPAKITEMCDHLGIELPKPKPTVPQRFDSLKSWIFGDTDHTQVEGLQAKLKEQEEAHEKALSAVRTRLQGEKDSLCAKYEAFEKEKTEEIEALNAKIKELEEKHLAAAASYETAPPADSGQGIGKYLCETTRRAMKK